jgi:TonB family protein
VIFREYAKPDKTKRPLPWFLSLMVHGGLLIWLLWPEGAIKATPTAYEQLFKGKEEKIVIYRFREKLPDVKPLRTADSRPARAEVRIPRQSIVASPKNAPKEKQIVVMPAPEVKEKPKFDSPNLLALQMAPPAPPERKKFTPKAAQPKIEKELAQPKAVDAPELTALAPTPEKLLDDLGAAPKLTQDNRPKFVVPPAQVKKTVAKVEEVDGGPPPPAGALPMSGPSLSALNIAVVGLNPGPKDAPLPTASHAAQFSAGPKLNPNGGAGEGNPNASLTVPDLMVRGAGGDAPNNAAAALLAANRVAPTSAENLRGLSKYAAPSSAESASLPTPGRGSAAKVSSAPNPRFDGKEVYSMAIQMPNITSYSGSWLMWYAARGMAPLTPLAPPVPYRKVDPKYIATAVVDRIEGRVQLLCVINRSGHVEQVELVRGLDPRLDQSAMEALAKWEFRPASRGGAPIDVDVMVEIPFHLAPKIPK